MTQQQIQDLVRQVLLTGGMIAAIFGYQSAWDTLASVVIGALGPASMIISLIWGYLANSKASLVSTVANMPEVKSVTLESNVSPEMTALNQATPSNVRPSVVNP